MPNTQDNWEEKIEDMFEWTDFCGDIGASVLVYKDSNDYNAIEQIKSFIRTKKAEWDAAKDAEWKAKLNKAVNDAIDKYAEILNILI